MVTPRRGSRSNGARPRSHSRSPSRGAPTGAPAAVPGSFVRTLRAFDGSLAQFLLVLIGGTCLIASAWNAERHHDVVVLDSRLERLERERDALLELADEEFRYHEAIDRDPRVAEDWYRRFFQNYDGAGIPLDEWIRHKDEQPEA